MKWFFKIGIFFFILSCSRDNRYSTLYLYSKDKTQAITVFTNKTFTKRIIANGKHNNLPKDDYYILDITNIDRDGDELGVCWKSKDHIWQIVNHDSKIIESNIDKSKYVLRTEWFKDKRLLPNASYYRKDNCFTVGTSKYDKVYPQHNGYIERVD